MPVEAPALLNTMVLSNDQVCSKCVNKQRSYKLEPCFLLLCKSCCVYGRGFSKCKVWIPLTRIALYKYIFRLKSPNAGFGAYPYLLYLGWRVQMPSLGLFKWSRYICTYLKASHTWYCGIPASTSWERLQHNVLEDSYDTWGGVVSGISNVPLNWE